MTYRAIVDPTRWVATASAETDVLYPAARVLSDLGTGLGLAGTHTPLAAGTGAVGAAVLYAREDHVHPAPVLTAVAYASGNFTAGGGGSWTVDSGDQTTFQYLLITPKLMLLTVRIDASTTASSATNLKITIPASATAAVNVNAPFTYFDGTNWGTGIMNINPSSGIIDLYTATLAAWPNATNSVRVSLDVLIPLT